MPGPPILSAILEGRGPRIAMLSSSNSAQFESLLQQAIAEGLKGAADVAAFLKKNGIDLEAVAGSIANDVQSALKRIGL